MKLTSIKDKISDSISTIPSECYNKIFILVLGNIRWKTEDEIRTPSWESITRTQRRILNNLENEIN